MLGTKLRVGSETSTSSFSSTTRAILIVQGLAALRTACRHHLFVGQFDGPSSNSSVFHGLDDQDTSPASRVNDTRHAYSSGGRHLGHPSELKHDTSPMPQFVDRKSELSESMTLD